MQRCSRIKQRHRTKRREDDGVDTFQVPIIKLETVANGLEVDINMNNIAGVYNSHLMHYYSRYGREKLR